MSSSDNKKMKRRKNKKAVTALGKATTNTNSSNSSQNQVPEASLSEAETLKKLEKLMDSKEEPDLPRPELSRGPNPYLDQERCLLCGCERKDPPEAANLLKDSSENKPKTTETKKSTQLPIWVCPTCRQTADNEMEKKSSLDSFLDQDLYGDSSTLSFLSESNINTTSEPTTPDGSICQCEACNERRQIEAEHELETQELQKCWTELRDVVRRIYSNSEEDGDIEPFRADEEKVKEHVHRLCSRDAHQLFLRIESQVKEFVIEKKVKLLKQLNSGFKSPPEAKQFISLLLNEYTHLCKVARLMAGMVNELEKEHLKRFNVTWELHNKHLFHSIAYTDPTIHSSLGEIIMQLRQGAASKEAYNEDTYPNLLHRHLKFDDEMSVISVVWRDCQQLIETYNEEQAALKLKQKMLKEDWEFFRAQRKILEQKVLKKPQTTISHSLETHFTETMRQMLNKNPSDQCHCRRCNQTQTCSCDECTITHMITCGIINPEALEQSPSHHNSMNIQHDHHSNMPFPHDPNRYIIDVSPPSMSSTSSSSGCSSPIMVDPDRLTLLESPDKFENDENIPEEIDEDDDEDEDDDDEDDGESDEDDDDSPSDVDSDDEEEELFETSGVPDQPSNLLSAWTDEQKALSEVMGNDGAPIACDCHHCVSQAEFEQMMKIEDNQCQCHVCLQQQGKTVSTSLPQHVPVTPRPAELHLYPHIHGSAGLHGMHNRSHIRPVLQPHLYDIHDLHMRQQPKSGISSQSKIPPKFEFDSLEGPGQNIYNDYGEWDNTTYDSRMLIAASHKFSGSFGSELLTTPPPLQQSSSVYSDNGITSLTQNLVTANSSVAITTSAFRPSISATSSANLTVTSNGMQSGSESCEGSARLMKCASQANSSNKNIGPQHSRPSTIGSDCSQKMDKPPQHCKKHGMPISSMTNDAQAQKINGKSSDSQHAKTVNGKDDIALRNMFQNLKNLNPCSHANANARNNPNHCFQSVDSSSSGVCPTSSALPSSVNNVSVGTSTHCADPDCDGHHDENYDSIDDSCSEQSSSTSTSNQKEGKYCDCCYCEFFGHSSTQMAAPTSKNYPEMRERLRLRLKKKNEAKTDDLKPMIGLEPSHQHHPKDTLNQKGLDELIKYINGTEEERQKAQSAKAAKRARQKQRKADDKEKARKVEEKEKQKSEEKLKTLDSLKKSSSKHTKECIMKTTDNGSNSDNTSQGSLKKKKKLKHKEAEMSHVLKHSSEGTTNHVKPTPASISNTVLQNHVHISSSKTANLENRHSTKYCDHKNNSNICLKVLKEKAERSEKAKKEKREQESFVVRPLACDTIQQKTASSPKTQQKVHKQNSESPKPNKTVQSNTPSNCDSKSEIITNGKRSLMSRPRNAQKPILQSQKNEINHCDSDRVMNGTASVMPPLVNNITESKKRLTVADFPAKQNHILQQNNKQNQEKPNIFSQLSEQKAKSVNNNFKNAVSVDNVPRNKKESVSTKPDETSPRQTEQNKGAGKTKKNKRKNKGSDDINTIDDIFMPKSESDLDGDMDEHEKEIEEFKRFCFDSTPQKREKIQVNVNVKDIFTKKKSGLACS